MTFSRSPCLIYSVATDPFHPPLRIPVRTKSMDPSLLCKTYALYKQQPIATRAGLDAHVQTSRQVQRSSPRSLFLVTLHLYSASAAPDTSWGLPAAAPGVPQPGKSPVLPVARMRCEKGRAWEEQGRKKKVRVERGFCIQPQAPPGKKLFLGNK